MNHFLRFGLALFGLLLLPHASHAQGTIPDPFEYVIASVLDNGAVPGFPRAEDRGRPHAQNTAAALVAGTVQPAGRRLVVLYVWGAADLQPYELVQATQQASPRMGRRPVAVSEISPRDAPQFDPAYALEGQPRAFRVSYEGGALGLTFSRSRLRGLDILICPEGPTNYPDRVSRRPDGRTAQGGLWLVRAENLRMTGPNFSFASLLPLVWDR